MVFIQLYTVMKEQSMKRSNFKISPEFSIYIFFSSRLIIFICWLR